MTRKCLLPLVPVWTLLTGPESELEVEALMIYIEGVLHPNAMTGTMTDLFH